MLNVLESQTELFACPHCSGSLTWRSDPVIVCNSCGNQFGFQDEVPLLFCPNQWDGKSDITETMKSFYEETPFPDYDDIDSTWRLIEKAERGIFASLLNKQIPPHARILEAGCGTGQLSNYLGIAPGRQVIGADMCLNSLRLANDFRKKNNIENVGFTQMNLFKPTFKPASFDVVISNGVLHHTSAPYDAFRSILKLVKPSGFVIVGLYNSYARIPTDLRRLFFRFSAGAFSTLDPHLRNKMSSRKRRAWFMDQYQNPHESKHSMDEVLRWFDENDVEFVNSVPKTSLFRPFLENESLFKSNPRESAVDRLLVQLALMMTGSKEGGLFIMIGRKKRS